MLRPRPASISTTAPIFTSLATVAGTRGTRLSPATNSLGMKTRIVPERLSMPSSSGNRLDGPVRVGAISESMPWHPHSRPRILFARPALGPRARKLTDVGLGRAIARRVGDLAFHDAFLHEIGHERLLEFEELRWRSGRRSRQQGILRAGGPRGRRPRAWPAARQGGAKFSW